MEIIEDSAGLDGRQTAGFDERAVAFGVDYALFLGAYYLTLSLFFPGTPVLVNRQGTLWFALWGALFLLYHAYCSCEGRRSLGKSLLGLRVVDLQGEPLSLGPAVIRSAGYLVSSIGCLGFLWPLFNSAAQAWHDLAAGSVVVRERPRGEFSRMLVRASALACLSLFAMSWMWHNVWAERYHHVIMTAYAHTGFDEISRLETRYREKKGHYATSLLSLSTVSRNPSLFLHDMGALYDLRAGFEIKADRKGYLVRATAKDGRGTPVRFAGS